MTLKIGQRVHIKTYNISNHADNIYHDRYGVITEIGRFYRVQIEGMALYTRNGILFEANELTPIYEQQTIKELLLTRISNG